MTPAQHRRAVALWREGQSIAAVARALNYRTASAMGAYMMRNREDFPKRNRGWTAEAEATLRARIYTVLNRDGKITSSQIRQLAGTNNIDRIIKADIANGVLQQDPRTAHNLRVFRFPPPNPERDGAALPAVTLPAPRPRAGGLSRESRKAQVRAAIAKKEARFHARYQRPVAALGHNRRAILASETVQATVQNTVEAS